MITGFNKARLQAVNTADTREEKRKNNIIFMVNT